MALKAPLTFNQPGKIGGINNAFIVSKKQYENPVAKEADSIKECFAQTAFWLNKFSSDYTYSRLSALSEMLLFDMPEAFLRNGFLIRKYGKIYPFQTPEYPAVGQTIAPTAKHIPTIFEDMTGKKILQLSAGVDFHKYQQADVFIDMDKYQQYYTRFSALVGDSFARSINAISSILATAPFGWTMTTDVNIAPFFDSNALPDENDSKPANEYFKSDSVLFKWLKEEVVGQVQDKFKNKIYYNPELFNIAADQVEIVAPTTPTVADNMPTDTQKKIYFIKDANNKQKTKPDINRFTSLVALVQSMNTWVAGATRIDSPTNMAFYEPYKTAARTENQTSTKVNASELLVLMNVYDKAACEQAIGNTSAAGNWNTSLAPITSKGITVLGEDTIPPGHWLAVTKGMFIILKLFQNLFHLDFPWYPGEQFGGHCWLKFYCNKFMPAVAGIPTSFIPSENYYTHHFNAMKVS